MNLNNQPENSSTEYKLSLNGPNFELSPNFKLIEFTSKDGADRALVHSSLIDGLEAIRIHFKFPVVVNSGYRTPEHNQRIGGRPNSRHKFGLAADIMIKGIQPHKISAYAERLGFGGIGRYRTFIHVDVFGQNRRWSG